MSEATVGRILHFWPHGEKSISGSQPLAAIITYVHQRNKTAPQIVNLAVFGEHGRQYSETNVRLIEDNEDKRPEQRYATWPKKQEEPSRKPDKS